MITFAGDFIRRTVLTVINFMINYSIAVVSQFSVNIFKLFIITLGRTELNRVDAFL